MMMDIQLKRLDGSETRCYRSGLKCKTCGQKFGDCPGHFGHIELARPVIHVGHAKDVYKTLKAVCRDCGKLKLDASQGKFSKAIIKCN